MKTLVIGHSTCGRAIEVHSKSKDISKVKILVMSGLHGDEVEGILLSTMISNHFVHSEPQLLDKIVFLPLANPDGFATRQRWNINHVDLNRNWPSKDWTATFTNPRYPPGPKAESEIETQVLRTFFDNSSIEIVVDLHSFSKVALLPLLYRDNKTLEDAIDQLSKGLHIPTLFEDDALGYVVTGGFHTWCRENKIHTLTIEVEKGLGQFAIEEQYFKPMIQFLRTIL